MKDKSESKLKLFLDETGIKPSEFARLMDESPQNVNNWIKKGMPSSKAIIASGKLNVPLDKLVDIQADRITISSGIGAGKTRATLDAIRNIYMLDLDTHTKPNGMHESANSKQEEIDLLVHFKRLSRSGRYAVMTTLYKEIEKLEGKEE